MVVLQALLDSVGPRENIEDAYRIIFNLMPCDENRQPLQRVLRLLLRAVETMEHVHGYLDLCFDVKYGPVYGTLSHYIFNFLI